MDESVSDGEIDANEFLSFAFSGDARFALVSRATGKRIDLMISRAPDRRTANVVLRRTKAQSRVRLGSLTGAGFRFLTATLDREEAKAFAWFWRRLTETMKIPESVEVIPKVRTLTAAQARKRSIPL